jgi:hypothetical protein
MFAGHEQATIPLAVCLQGFAECFDTIALLLSQGRVPFVKQVLASWQSQHWSGSAKIFFLQRVSRACEGSRSGLPL